MIVLGCSSIYLLCFMQFFIDFRPNQVQGCWRH